MITFLQWLQEVKIYGQEVNPSIPGQFQAAVSKYSSPPIWDMVNDPWFPMFHKALLNILPGPQVTQLLSYHKDPIWQRAMRQFFNPRISYEEMIHYLPKIINNLIEIGTIRLDPVTSDENEFNHEEDSPLLSGQSKLDQGEMIRKHV